jgi:hypothetical protein
MVIGQIHLGKIVRVLEASTLLVLEQVQILILMMVKHKLGFQELMITIMIFGT